MTSRQQQMQALFRQIRDAQTKLDTLLREDAAGVVEDVSLETAKGAVALSALFGPHQDLILSFNMGTHCAYCTLWADEANGVLRHLEQRAAFVVASPDPPGIQRSFAESRGWTFRMVSHRTTDFAVQEGFATRDGDDFETLMPGFATYRKEEGQIRRTGRAFYGPGDVYCSVYHFFDQLEGGADGWYPVVEGTRGE